MDESNRLNDDFQFDRLVDGELSADEQRELLASLEAQPGSWRRCALAFIEAQAWRREMRSITAAPVKAATLTTLASSPSPSRARKRFDGSWLALAAALLVAFGVGRQLGTSEQARLGSLQDQAAQIAVNEDRTPPAVEQAIPSTGDAVTLVVNDQSGVPHRVSVPLVEGRNLGVQFAETPHWSSSPELTRRLNQQGLDLTARRRYAPMYFEQQNQLVPMIVPVDDAVVTPVSRPVY